MQRAVQRYAPLLSLAVVALLTLAGGEANSVDARGRVVDDTDNAPVPGIAVTFGSRAVVTDADGRYVMDGLPRNARLTAQKPGYSRSSTAADSPLLRLVPLTITFEVTDKVTGMGVDTPEARQPASVRIGQGSASGEMVVGPYPARDRPLIVCATGYESKEVTAHGVLMNVALKPGGVGCPPLPSPAPTVQPTPSPSASSAPSGSPSPGAP